MINYSRLNLNIDKYKLYIKLKRNISLRISISVLPYFSKIYERVIISTPYNTVILLFSFCFYNFTISDIIRLKKRLRILAEYLTFNLFHAK